MSDLDEYKKERQELVEARRLKNKQAPTGIFPEKGEEPIVPKTFGEKWKNFWYHYKFHMLALALVLVIVVVFLWQVVFPTRYDASMTIVSSSSFEGSYDVVSPGLLPLLADQNGDDKILLDYATFQLAVKDERSEMTPQTLEMTRSKLLGRVSTWECFLFLMDETGYEQLTSVGAVFMDLSEAFPDNDRIRGDKYDLGGSELAKLMNLDNMLEDKFLCFIDYNDFDEKSQQKKKIKTAYEHDWAFLQKLVAVG